MPGLLHLLNTYIVHKGFSGIELQKYHLKYGQIGKSSTYLKNQVDE